MSDSRPWLKLWKTAYSDAGLNRLSLEDQARWFRLLLFVGINGERGQVVLRDGPRDLIDCLFPPEPDVDSWDGDGELPSQALPRGVHGASTARPRRVHRNGSRDVRRMLQRLPGIHHVSDGHGLTVIFTKWAKYQEDSSAERTRRWRHRERRDGISPSQRDGTSDANLPSHQNPVTVVEEKRRDTPISPSSQPRPTPPPEAFSPDCPVERWRGRCVSPQFLAEHPDAMTTWRLPVSGQTDAGQPLPKQCPHHRGVQTSADHEVHPAW